jgi:hypothetical protein
MFKKNTFEILKGLNNKKNVKNSKKPKLSMRNSPGSMDFFKTI